MGIAGVRDMDTQKFFEDKKPLCVVYFDVEYSLDPKGIYYMTSWVYMYMHNMTSWVYTCNMTSWVYMCNMTSWV